MDSAITIRCTNLERLHMKIKLLLGLVVTAFPSSVVAVSWEKAIEAVEAKGLAYYQYAVDLDPLSRPGTALQGIGFDRNKCAIIGRMLGFDKEIREAETLDDPPMTPDADPQELMRHSMVLDSWGAAARHALAMSDAQKKGLWNLECVGKHGISHEARLEDTDLVGDFSVDGNNLYVYGDINPGFSERFIEFLEANPEVENVMLGSAGGSVLDALLAGYEIRSKGLSTTLFGPCYSACPLLFAGGKSRMIWMGPGPHLGFHRIYNQAGVLPMDHEYYQLVAEYLSAMNVDPLFVINWMSSAGPDEIFEPDLSVLCQPGMATWVQRVC